MAPPLRTTTPDWGVYLDRLNEIVADAESELAAGRPMTWPDLAAPADPPTPNQAERATALIDRMAAVLDTAEQRREDLRRMLNGLRPTPPPNPAAQHAWLGGRLDVRG